MIENLDKPTLVGNPLDVENLQRQDEAAFNRCLAAFFQEPRVDTVGVRLNLPDSPTSASKRLYQTIADLKAASNKRVVLLSRATESLANEWYTLFQDLELPFVREYRKGLRALRRLRNSERDRACDRFTMTTRSGPGPSRPRFQEGGVLPFEETAKLLDAYGIPLAPTVMAHSPEDAVRAADQLGYPCVLKVTSVDIPHKTEYGALALGLENGESVRRAYGDMISQVRKTKPSTKIEGIMVQRHLRGIECLLGITRDEQLGPLLVMGLGGVFVEVLADIAIRIPPITVLEARRALDSLKGRAILYGVRGASANDIEAIAEMASRLSWLAYDLGDEIAEMDLNPVVVLPDRQGALAVDALTVIRNPRG
jgi:acyl-CoA synthetase (NDP forming)